MSVSRATVMPISNVFNLEFRTGRVYSKAVWVERRYKYEIWMDGWIDGWTNEEMNDKI